MNERYRSLRVQAVERDANGHVVHAIVQSAISVIGGGGDRKGYYKGDNGTSQLGAMSNV